MTWGDDIALKLQGTSAPASFNPCYVMWEKLTTPCQLISLADLKTILGITDNSQDDELTRLINVYSTAIERYTERRLCAGDREMVVVPRPHCSPETIRLPEFPVNSITHFDNSGAVLDQTGLDALIYDANRGVILPTTGSGWQISQYLHIKYNAGYDPVPADLENAIVDLCSRALNSGVGAGETGPIKSQRVEGAVTETYYDPRSTSTTSTSASAAADIGTYASVLDFYRGERAFV